MRLIHHISLVTVLVIFGVIAAGVIVGYFVFWNPKVIAVSPANENGAAALDQEIVLRFDKPVDRRTLRATLRPEIDGQWSYETPIIGIGNHFYRALRFTPNRILDPETEYTIEVTGITNAISFAAADDFTASFTTETLPDVAGVAPADKETPLNAFAPVRIKLTAASPEYAQYRFRLQPETEVKIQQTESLDEYLLSPEQSWQQGAEYELKVERVFVAQDTATGHVLQQSEPATVYTGEFTIAPPPNISELSPTGTKVAISAVPSFTFTQAMDLDSLREHFSMSPEINGVLSANDEATTFTFTPDDDLQHATEYTVHIAEGAATADGGFLAEAVSYRFSTIGPVSVSYITPESGAQGIDPNTSIRIAFDQEVEHAAAEAAFSFTPERNGNFSWEGNTLLFHPAEPLAYGTSYTAHLNSGINGVHGPASVETFSSTFSTAPQTVQLAVAADLQDKPLSCEAAALKMALANKGISVSENDIMARVPTNPAHRSGGVWGDPYSEFVGDINGKQNTTGYGVYWGPIASAGNAWRPSEAFTGWSLQQLTSEIQNGNAVVVWGVYGSGYRDDWVTPGGKSIYAWKGEHARTVIGFVGAADNPQRIILNDPYAGRISWTRAQFERDWAIFGNAGVVVR